LQIPRDPQIIEAKAGLFDGDVLIAEIVVYESKINERGEVVLQCSMDQLIDRKVILFLLFFFSYSLFLLPNNVMRFCTYTNEHVTFPKRHSCFLQVRVVIRVLVAPTFELSAQSKPLSVTNHRLEFEVYYEQKRQAHDFTWRVSLSHPSN